MFIRKFILMVIPVLMLVTPVPLSATTFQCSIKSVLALGETGSVVTHGWSANYLNRKFTVDRETGKVINTTALKVRLSNYNSESIPQVLDNGDKNNSYKAVTLFEETGGYASLEINNLDRAADLPFIYHTNIGMILTGNCDKQVTGNR